MFFLFVVLFVIVLFCNACLDRVSIQLSSTHQWRKHRYHLLEQHEATCVEISTCQARTTIWLDLPPEIIIQIAEFLPTLSAASLVLCNKRAAAQLGSRTWNLFSKGSEDCINFLSILSRDLPRHHVCHGCSRFHLSSSIPLPSDFSAPREPDPCFPEYPRGNRWGRTFIPRYFSPYELRFSHVQLALKRHHYGPNHGIPLSDLSHTDLKSTDDAVYFFSVDARIASDKLVMRSQEWVVSRRPLERSLSDRLSYRICSHQWTEEFRLYN